MFRCFISLLSTVLLACAADPHHQATPSLDPPRFTWSPQQGYVFAEGSCGTDDQTLGWMSPPNPTRLREARIVMFARGDQWRAQFKETTAHFIARWMALKGRQVIVVPGDHGRLKDDPIHVPVPEVTPFQSGSFQEAMYLQGYAGGYMDGQNLRQSTNCPVAGARGDGWREGWTVAKRRKSQIPE